MLQASTIFRSLFLTSLLLFSNSQLYADSKVTLMGDTFYNSLPDSWNKVKGDWQYFDVKKCFTSGDSCYGNNPSSPYAYPVFNAPPSEPTLDFKLNASDAVVIFLRTPPEMKYFGFTQYLFTRGGVADPIFASMSDTLNLLQVKTFGSNQPGLNVFNQHMVLVWSADLNTYESIKKMLVNQGILETGINYIGMPIKLPLVMGETQTSDSFNMLMRTAFPTTQADFEAYMKEKPFYVVKLGLKTPGPTNPAPTVEYVSDISGVIESTKTQSNAQLQTALDSLVLDIKKKYLKDFSFKDKSVSFTDKVGWDCISGKAICNGDNHDALYSLDVPGAVLFNDPKDVVIVIGVNHQKTGKALYVNHSVYDTVKIAGIVGVGDSALSTESALFHAGVKSPNDPRRIQYQNLYAYAISYDCTGLNFCLQIPPPTPDNPVGLLPKSPFLLISRTYVDKLTKVRPSMNEVIKHQVIIGSKKY